jgi:murein DD-endopeptidase MepM/ murein hydrolase activator NlpD
MAKTIKRIKSGIELNIKRGSKLYNGKYLKYKAFKGINLGMPSFDCKKTKMPEDVFQQKALIIKNQIKTEIENKIKEKVSKIREIDFDKRWEDQKSLKGKKQNKIKKLTLKRVKEKRKKIMAKLLIFTKTIKYGTIKMFDRLKTKIKKYYKAHPEKEQERREKNKKIFRKIILLKRKIIFYKRKIITRENSFAERMAKIIFDIDHKNEDLAEKTITIVKRSNLKLLLAREYAEMNKAKLLIKLVIILTIFTIMAAGASYVTAYEYSYNGRVLGVVENQEDVLKLLDILTEQLSKEYNTEVRIDKELDISFKKIISVNREIDDSEEVLKKLTYMQDMKAVAYGIFINDKREVIVSSKENADIILESVKNKFLNTSGNTKYENIGFAENIEIKVVQTKLGRIQNVEDALKIIMTGAIQSKVHIVEPGDTFSGIAKKYDIDSAILSQSNPGITPERLSIGQEIVLTQAVPLITVQTIEVATYIEPIAYETKKENTNNLYSGEQSVKIRGKNGEREIVARITKNNGIEVAKTELKATIIKESVTQILLVGTKPPPPLQGTGTYIYPVVGARLTQGYSSYHRAIDLAVPTGTKVRASDGGTVIFAGYSGSYGYMIRINHGGNRVTLYAHCSKLLVRAGDKVYQGQHIANSGSTGRSTGPHVHFEVLINGVQKNPLNYL